MEVFGFLLCVVCGVVCQRSNACETARTNVVVGRSGAVCMAVQAFSFLFACCCCRRRRLCRCVCACVCARAPCQERNRKSRNERGTKTQRDTKRDNNTTRHRTTRGSLIQQGSTETLIEKQKEPKIKRENGGETDTETAPVKQREGKVQRPYKPAKRHSNNRSNHQSRQQLLLTAFTDQQTRRVQSRHGTTQHNAAQ